MIVLGLDFETTGLDPENDLITEVGAVLWDTADDGKPLVIFSELVNFPGAQISPEIEQAVGISQEMLEAYGKSPEGVLFDLCYLMAKSTAVVAHNGSVFDQLFWRVWTTKRATPTYIVPDTPWIDTQVDLEFPESVTTRKLKHLAAEYNFLNPFSHRAVFDVLTMLKVFQQFDPERALWMSKQPTVFLIAVTKFDQKELVKERKFRWNPDRKLWWKSIKAHLVEQEQAACPFKTTVLDTLDFPI